MTMATLSRSGGRLNGVGSVERTTPEPPLSGRTAVVVAARLTEAPSF